MTAAQLKRMAQLEAELAVAMTALVRISCHGVAESSAALAKDAIKVIEDQSLPTDWEHTYAHLLQQETATPFTR